MNIIESMKKIKFFIATHFKELHNDIITITRTKQDYLFLLSQEIKLSKN